MDELWDGGEGGVFLCDDEEAEGGVGSECGAEASGVGAGLGPRGRGGLCVEGLEGVEELVMGVGGEGEDLDGVVPVDLFFCGEVFFEEAVEVAAAEAEGADAGASRVVGAWEPGAFFGVDVECGVTRLDGVEGLIDFDGGWEDFVVECESGFDEACDTGGGLGVSDHGFDGAERAPGRRRDWASRKT